MGKPRKIVLNNEIVYANWFLRQLDVIWDFIYFELVPWKLWNSLMEIKHKIVYAFERAFTGYDRTISWSHISTIKFYKRLLSDLIEHSIGFPTNLEEICPEEWEAVKKKYASKCRIEEAKAFIGLTCGLSDEEHKHFSDDMFNAWKAYLRRILHYLDEADPDTCSEKNELENQYKWTMNEHREIVEHDGELYYSYPPIDPNDPQEQINQKIIERDTEIAKYQKKNLDLAMQEIAKNLMYLAD